jgi:hypothetical protein
MASSRASRLEEGRETRDEALPNETVVNLLPEGLELHDSEVGIDAGQGVADDLAPGSAKRDHQRTWRPIVSKSRKLGFLEHQAADDSFFDLFSRLREEHLIP